VVQRYSSIGTNFNISINQLNNRQDNFNLKQFNCQLEFDLSSVFKSKSFINKFFFLSGFYPVAVFKKIPLSC
jgi:hypothetical protein